MADERIPTLTLGDDGEFEITGPYSDGGFYVAATEKYGESEGYAAFVLEADEMDRLVEWVANRRKS